MSLYESRRTFKPSNASHILPLTTRHDHSRATQRILGLTMQQLSLVILVIQNSVLVLVMRQSRRPIEDGSATPSLMYLASTAVFFAEVIKLVCCTGMLYWTTTTTTTTTTLETLGRFLSHGFYDQVLKNWRGILLMMIPSGLYALQNNLLYVALSHLEAATFQVTYQLKILSTAIFSMLLLDRRLTRQQWAALVLLMAGVTMVQLSTVATAATAATTTTTTTSVTWIGLMAVLASCVSSGFAGCYFERILKSRSSGPTVSIWVRNIHLGICGSLFSFIGMMVYDRQRILENGFFQGYDGMTGWVIMNQALGGLVVSMVMKYADNILKAFATSLSIILSSVISVYLFEFNPSFSFIIGTLIVLLSTYLYGRPTTLTFKPD